MSADNEDSDHILFQEANETVFDNIFDSLSVLSALKKAVLTDELTQYLTTPTEAAPDPLLWWIEKQAVYPCLSHMTRDNLSIPGMQLIIIFIKKLTFYTSNFC